MTLLRSISTILLKYNVFWWSITPRCKKLNCFRHRLKSIEMCTLNVIMIHRHSSVLVSIKLNKIIFVKFSYLFTHSVYYDAWHVLFRQYLRCYSFSPQLVPKVCTNEGKSTVFQYQEWVQIVHCTCTNSSFLAAYAYITKSWNALQGKFHLKVHKIEIFLASILKFVLFLY